MSMNMEKIARLQRCIDDYRKAETMLNTAKALHEHLGGGQGVTKVFLSTGSNPALRIDLHHQDEREGAFHLRSIVSNVIEDCQNTLAELETEINEIGWRE